MARRAANQPRRQPWYSPLAILTVFTGDGAYDTTNVYAAVAAHHADAAVIVSRSTAVASETPSTDPAPRDRHGTRIAERGHIGWQKASGYNRPWWASFGRRRQTSMTPPRPESAPLRRRRRHPRADLESQFSRATDITILLANGGALEHAQEVAGRAPGSHRARCPPSPAQPDVSPSGIVGFRWRERVLLRDELEGQAAAAKDRAALHGTALKAFEQQNRLALVKTDVHIDISLGEG